MNNNLVSLLSFIPELIIIIGLLSVILLEIIPGARKWIFHTVTGSIILAFLYMMFIWYGISLIWAPDIQLAFKYLFYIFCGLIISLSIINYSYSLDRLNSLFKTLCCFWHRWLKPWG